VRDNIYSVSITFVIEFCLPECKRITCLAAVQVRALSTWKTVRHRSESAISGRW